MRDISVLIALGYGLASFFTPCVLPLVPVYLANLAGPAVLEGGSSESRLPIFFHSLCFVCGFSLVFTILGAGAGLLGLAINTNLPIMRQVAGTLLIVFGLLMLAALKIPWLNYEKRLVPSLRSTTGYLRSFLIGAFFPLAWIPCSSWVLGGILMLAGTSETAIKGAYLLAAYSLGLGLPFLVIGATFDAARLLLRPIYRYTTIIYIIGGLALIAIGILILTNQLALFAV